MQKKYLNNHINQHYCIVNSIEKYQVVVPQDVIKQAIKLIYFDQDYGNALDFVEAHVPKNSIEFLLFQARILASSGFFHKSRKISAELLKSDTFSRLFYLLDYANENLTLDLVNIGHKLRGSNQVEKSEQYMRSIFQAQIKRNLINRTTVIQQLINQSKSKLYLELGVFVGHNFLQIEATKKVAVDPDKKIQHTESLPNDSIFYEVTSDTFFENQMDPLLIEKFDVIFIDGLHTYQQSLHDVLNSLKYLKEDGVIVMHDCFPKSKSAAHPVMEEAQQMDGFNGFWNGDVYKTIIWLRSNRPDLEVSVLDADHGLGIIKKGKSQGYLTLTDQSIATMTYEEFANNPISLLNLKPKSYFNVWL